MTESYVHVFPAIRGVQAGREFYVAMCPLRLIPRLFQFNEAEVPPQMRAQRILNKARIPEIAHYMANNPKDYIFSSLTASIDGQVRFDPAGAESTDRNLGSLVVPMDARILINDGQHRRAAIEDAINVQPQLGDEHISVVFFLDRGLKKSQQMFADLNKHAVRPTKSIGILFDHRDPMSQLACNVASEVDVFRDLIEFEKTTISNRAIKLFTLSSLFQATRALLGKAKRAEPTDKEQALAVEFWNAVCSHMPDWKLAAERKVASADLRRDYIHAHGVVLHALGIAGGQLLTQEPRRWKSRLKKLEGVDWSRSNREWEGKALVNGRVSKSHQSLLLTAAQLKQILGVSLSVEEKRAQAGSKGRRRAA